MKCNLFSNSAVACIFKYIGDVIARYVLHTCTTSEHLLLGTYLHKL